VGTTRAAAEFQSFFGIRQSALRRGGETTTDGSITGLFSFNCTPTTVATIVKKRLRNYPDFFVVHTTASMPTRAAAAAAAAANMRTTRSRNVSTPLKGKENGPPSSTTKSKEKPVPKKTIRIVKAKKVEEMFCSCRGVDDGTPMVQCGTCDEWSAQPLSPLLPLHPRTTLISS